MKTVIRMTALMLALLMLAVICCGCSDQKEQEQRVIGTCAGYEIRYEELRYLTLTYKSFFEDTYGEGIWDDPATAEQYRAELEETVFRLLLNNYAVLAAGDYYLPQKNAIASDGIQDAVDEMIDSMVESYGGKKGYRQELKKMNATDNLLRFTCGVSQVENELMHALVQDWNLIEDDPDDFYDWMKDGNYVYVQHVFVCNNEGEKPEDNRAIAEQARLDLLNKVKTIEQLVGSSVNEDTQNVSPYYVVRGVYKPNIEDAVFDLAFPGDVSYVTETETGFYVFVRMESDDSTLLAQVNKLLNDYQIAMTESYVEEFKKDLKIEWNEYGASLDLLTIQ